MKKPMKIHLQPKLLLGLVTMAAVLALSLAPSISGLYRSKMEDYYAKSAFQQASIAAALIDGDSIANYYTTGQKDAYYDEIAEYLSTVKDNVGLAYFYVVVPEDEYMVYIWDAGTAGEGGVCELGDTDVYYENGNELMHNAFSVNAEQTILITNSAEYGYLASAYVAILDGNGNPAALASVDISMDKINSQIREFLRLTLFVTFAALLISVVAYYIYVRKILIGPLHVLHRSTKDLVENHIENLDTFKLDIHTGDEVEELADSFEYMVGELNVYIRNLSLITAEKERIRAELDVARHIQASMLPFVFPAFPDRHDFDIYATMTPAKEVGGDFYDFFLIDEDHLAVVMADVSGKGVPAALFMMISKMMLKSAAQSGLSPKAVLEKVNNQLCENNDAGMFVTVWLGILEISTGKMVCANAGHELPAIKHRNGDFELFKDKHGFVLAGMENSRYREYELELHKGDCLFVYTDGVTEALDKNKQLFGLERMVQALNRAKDKNCAELLQSVHADIQTFVGEAEQFDDITMLALTLLDEEKTEKEATFPATVEAMGDVKAFVLRELQAAGCADKAEKQIRMAIDEIYTNIASYAYPDGTEEAVATVRVSIEKNVATVSFEDGGIPFNPLEHNDPDVSLRTEERQVGGLGIFMVKKTMDSVAYEYRNQKNILTLRKTIS